MVQKEYLQPDLKINYTSVVQAVEQFPADPYGDRVLRFLRDGFNIDNPVKILEATGMKEYLRYKAEGRFIGLVATQILRPSFYFLSNAIVLNDLAQRGLPAALMVFEYPEDIFLTRNHDKKAAFGWQEFYLDEKHSVRLNIRPSRLQTKSFPLASLDSTSGWPCEQIMVKTGQAQGPGNMPYPDISYALGLNIPEEISVTDFYRILWQETINRLHLQLPVFYVDMVKLYSTLAQASPAFNHQKRMLTAAEYYPLQVAWPDLYLESSGGCGADFDRLIINAQQMRYEHGLPEVQVHLPNAQVPELEKLCLHPTGRFVDFSLNPQWQKINEQIRLLVDQMPKLSSAQEEEKRRIEEKIEKLKIKPGNSYIIEALSREIPKLSPPDKKWKGELGQQIYQLRTQQSQLSLPPQEYIKEVPFSLPLAVQQVHNQLLSGVPEYV